MTNKIFLFLIIIFLTGSLSATQNASSPSYSIESFLTGISGSNASSSTYSLISTNLYQPSSKFTTTSYNGTSNWVTSKGTPNLKIIRPLNGVYFSGTNIKLNYTIGITDADSVWYNLDGGSNTTLTGNTTFDAADGNHTIYVFANNTYGLAKKNITFNVTAQPSILNLSNETTAVNIPSSYDNLNITIPTGVTEPKISVEECSVVSDSTSKNATIASTLAISASTTASTINISLPAGVKISGPANWTGEMILPTPKETSSVTITAGSGNQTDVSSVIEMGLEDEKLTFNKSVRILITGEGSKLTGYSRAGTFTKITNTCSADSQEAGDALAEGSECKIKVGSDIVVWTKHFTKFVTYTETEIPAESSPSGSSSSSGGGGGGSGGGSSEEIIPVPKSDKFIIDQNQISVSLTQGEVSTQTFTITNRKSTSVDFTIKSQISEGLIFIKESEFNLSPGESKEVSIDLIAREDTRPTLYLGKIIVNGGNEQNEILVAINVESKGALLDVRAEIPLRYQKIQPGEELLTNINMFNLGISKRADINIKYVVTDFNGNTITTKNETLAIETQTSFVTSIDIPLNTPYGKYVLYVEATYDGKVAGATANFEVVSGVVTKNEKIFIGIIIVTLMLLGLGIYYHLKEKYPKERFKKKIDLNNLIKRK